MYYFVLSQAPETRLLLSIKNNCSWQPNKLFGRSNQEYVQVPSLTQLLNMILPFTVKRIF